MPTHLDRLYCSKLSSSCGFHDILSHLYSGVIATTTLLWGHAACKQCETTRGHCGIIAVLLIHSWGSPGRLLFALRGACNIIVIFIMLLLG
jgi:hypothetical protein